MDNPLPFILRHVSFFGSRSPFPFIRRQVSFFASDFIDQVVTRTTGKKCTFAGAVVSKLDKCKPWTDHFERSSLDSMYQANKLKDSNGMRILAALRWK
jgi:hypothetical protein